jgi:hypothetical protein
MRQYRLVEEIIKLCLINIVLAVLSWLSVQQVNKQAEVLLNHRKAFWVLELLFPSKIPSLLKTQRFGDWILSLSSGGT